MEFLPEFGLDAGNTDAKVEAAMEDGFVLAGGETIGADLKVWAAGGRAPGLLRSLDGLALTRNAQVVVDANLRCPVDPNILAVGDCASLTPEGEGQPLPPTAQVAYQQARYICRHLGTLLDGGAVAPFRFRHGGSLVSLGEFGAYGSLGKFGIFSGGYIRGHLAQLGHVFLYRSHQARLHDFWRGSLLWGVDLLNAKLRPEIRLD